MWFFLRQMCLFGVERRLDNVSMYIQSDDDVRSRLESRDSRHSQRGMSNDTPSHKTDIPGSS